ncbi:MAG: TetR/AcrR family transcriptional regulator [Pseudomonadota bacterium]
MPRPALTEAQRRETRRRIQQAAAAVYARGGLADITARKIADEAGIAVGSLYSYFDNLTELMQSLWKQPVRRLLKELDGELEGIEDPWLRLETFTRLYARFALEQRSTYRGAFMFVRPESRPAPERRPLEEDPFFSRLREVIERAQGSGQVRSGDPVQLAQTLWAGLHGATALPQNIDRLALDPPEQQLPRMIDALLQWLRASGGSAA